jgi:hypothetical protein
LATAGDMDSSIGQVTNFFYGCYHQFGNVGVCSFSSSGHEECQFGDLNRFISAPVWLPFSTTLLLFFLHSYMDN